MKIKAVVFDLDGPILDSFREGLRRIKTICAIHDIPFDRKHYKKLSELWGMPGVELLMNGLEVNETLAKTILYPAWERLDIRQPVSLVPRTREVLLWLRRNNIRTTILTSRQREHVIEMFDQLDLTKEFAIVSTKFDTPYRKPDPRVFYYTLEELKDKFNITKEECAFIGDTPADIDCGRAAEVTTLLVQTGPYLLKHAKDLLLPLGNILNSIDDVPAWIEENCPEQEFTFYD